MTRSDEEVRQAPMRDRLRAAFDAAEPVRVELRDGSERSGVLDEFHDHFSTVPGPATDFLRITYEIRFHGDQEGIRGIRIMAVD